MGKRISKVVTRTGDDGTTGLGDGSRVPKDDPRVVAIGEVDELNSVVGLLRAQRLPRGMDERLERIQHRLFDLGGELSVPGGVYLSDEAVAELEAWIGEWNAGLPPLEDFVLPAGDMAVASAHLARAVCRRAERAVVALDRTAEVRDAVRHYLNRLSDLFFVAARVIAQEREQTEQIWDNLDPWDSPDAGE